MTKVLENEVSMSEIAMSLDITRRDVYKISKFYNMSFRVYEGEVYFKKQLFGLFIDSLHIRQTVKDFLHGRFE